MAVALVMNAEGGLLTRRRGGANAVICMVRRISDRMARKANHRQVVLINGVWSEDKRRVVDA